jgi:hypothetical protein
MVRPPFRFEWSRGNAAATLDGMVRYGPALRVCAGAVRAAGFAALLPACGWIAGIEDLGLTPDSSATVDAPPPALDGATAEADGLPESAPSSDAARDAVDGGADVDSSVNDSSLNDSSLNDSSLNDSSLPHEASSDAADASDAAPPPPPTYSNLTDSANWEMFDMGPIGGQAWGYGGAFDGRFVYYTPGADNDTNIARYDTKLPFQMNTSWSSFNITPVSGGPYIYNGAAFDGQYIYLTPDLTENAGTAVGGIVRYDTTQSFTTQTSWSLFDTTTIAKGYAGYQGAVFDGSYLYFANSYTNTTTRFTTGAAFSDPTSWSAFTATSLDPKAMGFRGATFDGRFVYYVPYIGDQSTAAAGVVARYDTTASSGFASKSSWSSFDISMLNGNAVGFAGAVFDGRYVLLVPKLHSVAARFDTTQSLSAPGAWEFFDVTSLNDPAIVPFFGGTFDGRYVYLAPDTIYTGGSKLEVLVVRFDTTKSFMSGTSWEKVDLISIDNRVTGFEGAVFDGEYVYFVPVGGTVTARFLARKPPGLPPLWSASFF